jgi:hypothetical protein
LKGFQLIHVLHRHASKVKLENEQQGEVMERGNARLSFVAVATAGDRLADEHFAAVKNSLLELMRQNVCSFTQNIPSPIVTFTTQITVDSGCGQTKSPERRVRICDSIVQKFYI